MEGGDSSGPLPAPGQVRRLLVWHQGALGDLLLAGPALVALGRRYPEARFIAVGHPERWSLLHGTLPLEAVWNSTGARWLWLYSEQSPIPPSVAAALAGVEVAVVFSPKPPTHMPARLHQAGVSQVAWVPSFDEAGREPVARLQARRLAALGLAYEPEPLRLNFCGGGNPLKAALPAWWPQVGDTPLVAVAPGSGHPRKNWPLPHYYELTRTLAWEYRVQVVWLAGPAERAWLPYLRGLTRAQGMHLLAEASLAQVAHVLVRCQLYIGGDSGLTHLAAAAGTQQVLALFGPTDPRVWAPMAPQVRVITGVGDCLPCARGRDIPCSTSRCLHDLPPEQVMTYASHFLNPYLKP